MQPKNLWIFDENKLQILRILWTCDKNYCGCDLVRELNIKKNLISYHLKPLLEASILKEEKCGRNKHYTINIEQKKYIGKLLKIVNLI